MSGSSASDKIKKHQRKLRKRVKITKGFESLKGMLNLEQTRTQAETLGYCINELEFLREDRRVLMEAKDALQSANERLRDAIKRLQEKLYQWNRENQQLARFRREFPLEQ